MIRKIQGINVDIKIKDLCGMCHIQYFAENDAKTWISETGYRSQHLYPEEVKGMSDDQIVDYAINELKKEKGKTEIEENQNSLESWIK